MSDVANNNNKIQVESVRSRSAASESTMQSIGGAVNQLFDDNTAEIANRISGDAANAASITALTARVNAVGSLSRLYTNSVLVGGSISTPFSGGIPADFFIKDDFTGTGGTVNFAIFKSPANRLGSPVVPTQIMDTGIPFAANRFAVLTFGNTSIQYRVTIDIFEIDAV